MALCCSRRFVFRFSNFTSVHVVSQSAILSLVIMPMDRSGLIMYDVPVRRLTLANVGTWHGITTTVTTEKTLELYAARITVSRKSQSQQHFLLYYVPINDTPFEQHVFGHLIQNAVSN